MSDLQNVLSGRIVAVFNTGSGSCDASAHDQARQIFEEASTA